MEYTKESLAAYWNPGRKVFLYWAVALLVGFSATHLYQLEQINWLWLVISIGGLWYMYRFMPRTDTILWNIYRVWAGVIALGMVLSFLPFYLPSLVWLSGYLGIMWLVLMAFGHAATGYIDGKSVYVTTTLVQLVSAIAIAYYLPLLVIQYLVVGVVSSLAMVWLILFA